MGDFFSALSWIPSWWDILLIVSYVFVLLSVPSVLIEREGLPYAALAWILAMFAMPVVGLFFWWAFGRKHLAQTPPPPQGIGPRLEIARRSAARRRAA